MGGGRGWSLRGVQAAEGRTSISRESGGTVSPPEGSSLSPGSHNKTIEGNKTIEEGPQTIYRWWAHNNMFTGEVGGGSGIKKRVCKPV